MKTWKLISGVLLVFVVGLLFGSFGTQMILRHRFPLPPPHPGPKTEFLLERLSRDLALTESQRPRVRLILEQTDELLRRHFQQEEPQVRKIIDGSFSAIERELTDEQKRKLELIRERFERRRP